MTIKVIATDMDGTFLTDAKTYDKVLFEHLFDKLMTDDIKFVAGEWQSISSNYSTVS